MPESQHFPENQIWSVPILKSGCCFKIHMNIQTGGGLKTFTKTLKRKNTKHWNSTDLILTRCTQVLTMSLKNIRALIQCKALSKQAFNRAPSRKAMSNVSAVGDSEPALGWKFSGWERGGRLREQLPAVLQSCSRAYHPWNPGSIGLRSRRRPPALSVQDEDTWLWASTQVQPWGCSSSTVAGKRKLKIPPLAWKSAPCKWEQ